MILLIILVLFAVLILLFGFLDVKLPFISKKDLAKKHKSEPLEDVKIDDKLVKNSVEYSIKKTKLLKNKNATLMF